MSYWQPELGVILNGEDAGGQGVEADTFYGFNMFPETDGVEIVDAITGNSCACDYVEDGKAVVAWVETSTLKVKIVDKLLLETGYDNSGAAETIDASVTDTEWIDIVMTSSTQGYVFYQGAATTLNVCPITVSGTTVTAGSPATIASITSGYTLEGLVAIKVDATKIFIAWRDSNGSTARPVYRAVTYYDLGGTPTVSTILDDASTSSNDPYHPATAYLLTSDRVLLGINHNGGVGEYTVISGLSTNSLSQVDDQSFASSGRGGCIAGAGGATTAIGISIDTNNSMVIEELSDLDTSTIAVSTAVSGARALGYATQPQYCTVGPDSAFVFGANPFINAFGIENTDGTPQIGGAGLANPKDPGSYPQGSITKKTVDCCKITDNTALGVWIDNATGDLFMTRFR